MLRVKAVKELPALVGTGALGTGADVSALSRDVMGEPIDVGRSRNCLGGSSIARSCGSCERRLRPQADCDSSTREFTTQTVPPKSRGGVWRPALRSVLAERPAGCEHAKKDMNSDDTSWFDEAGDDVGSPEARPGSDQQRQSEDEDLRDSLAGLSRLASSQLSLEDLLTRVATYAVRAIPGADGAGLTLLEDGRADTIVSTVVVREGDLRHPVRNGTGAVHHRGQRGPDDHLRLLGG
jgi:hypothetical protein